MKIRAQYIESQPPVRLLFVYCAMLPTPIAARSQDAAKRSPEAASGSRLWVAAAIIAVLIVYAIPIVLPIVNAGRVQPVKMKDETIYLVRVAALLRGGTLGNPYLAGHDSEPTYMPGFSERVLAASAAGLHVPLPDFVIALRLLQPGLICALVAALAIRLGLSYFLSAAAGLLATVSPSSSQLVWHPLGDPGYLRYFRFLSPGTHVIFFLIAVLAVCWCWQRPRFMPSAIAGLAVGATFYLPIFYWAIIWPAAVCLCLLSADRQQRRWLAFAALIAAILAVPVA
ncbi:MAG TPA: hypothetical protein VE998_01495, partial [Terriglobales bacterium]|nr:hypothetical protein [Terriglobales bacterium]